jgi:hypothetical protein
LIGALVRIHLFCAVLNKKDCIYRDYILQVMLDICVKNVVCIDKLNNQCYYFANLYGYLDGYLDGYLYGLLSGLPCVKFMQTFGILLAVKTKSLINSRKVGLARGVQGSVSLLLGLQLSLWLSPPVMEPWD